MKKTIILNDKVEDNNGLVIATLQTYLRGDGSTPVVQTSGNNNGVIGYDDNGSPIMGTEEDELIKFAQQQFMAEAIKEQKKLCVENGVDPDLVNIINAEKKVNNE